jgi:hypothetical protein
LRRSTRDDCYAASGGKKPPCPRSAVLAKKVVPENRPLIEVTAMGMRRVRRMQRQQDMKTSRRKNGIVKKKERARRDLRMAGLLKAGKLPYIPSVMSWLSEHLGKASTRITQSDVDGIVK